MSIKTSLVMGSWKRKHLLELCLWSLSQQKIKYYLEVVVCNDYLPDGTEEVCKKFQDKLNIKYVFTGKRNEDGVKWRSAGYALNIGVRQATGDILLLSCPEILHLNNTIDLIVEPLKSAKDILSIGEQVWFDDTGNTIEYLQQDGNLDLTEELREEISQDPECQFAVQMPYLMGMYRQHYIDIGGYDEDFKGYACEDNDLMDRLKTKGLIYVKTKAEIVHLFHGKRCDSKLHWDNPMWVLNYKLFTERKGTIKRNEGKSWGKIDQ